MPCTDGLVSRGDARGPCLPGGHGLQPLTAWGLGIKETVHPGNWAGLRTRRPFFGKSGVASSCLPWCWWVVSDFPKPPSSGPAGSQVSGQWCQPLRTTRDGRTRHPPLPWPGPPPATKSTCRVTSSALRSPTTRPGRAASSCVLPWLSRAALPAAPSSICEAPR